MKRCVTITVVASVATVIGMSLFFLAGKSDTNEARQRIAAPAVNNDSTAAHLPSPTQPTEVDPLAAEQPRQEAALHSTQSRALRPTPTVPSAFAPVLPITVAVGPEMQSILAAVQDAASAIDGILICKEA